LADPSQIEDAILNLAINARDAMPNGGTLVIETANVHLDAQYVATEAEVTAGDYVLLSVTDTGSGMSDSADPVIYFMSGQLSAFSGFGTLRHFNL